MRMWHVAAAALRSWAVPRAPPTAQAGCNGQIDRYQAVAVRDHRTGNVNESVYGQIERELSRAAAACAARPRRRGLKPDPPIGSAARLSSLRAAIS